MTSPLYNPGAPITLSPISTNTDSPFSLRGGIPDYAKPEEYVFGGLKGFLIKANPYISIGLKVIGVLSSIFGHHKRPPINALALASKNPGFPDRCLPVVYGQMEVQPGLAFAVTQSLTFAGQRTPAFYVGVYDVCHGPIEGIGQVAYDDPLRGLLRNNDGSSGSILGLDGVNKVSTPIQSFQARVECYSGTVNQPASPFLITLFAGSPSSSAQAGLWDSSFTGSGVAYFAFNATTDPKFAFPIGKAPLTAFVFGKQVWDVRSGSNVPANQTGSDNPALCILDYLMNPIYGYGFLESEIYTQSFKDAANHCDDQKPSTASVSVIDVFNAVLTPYTASRYSCNGIVDTGRPLEQNLHDLCTSCNAQLVPYNGQIFIYIPQSQSLSGLAITDQNTVGVIETKIVGINDMMNEVRMSHMYQQAIPNFTFGNHIKAATASLHYLQNEVIVPTGTVNPFLAQDNNYPLIGHFNLPFTTDIHQAERLGTIALKRSRHRFRTTRVCTDELIQAMPGTIVTITDDDMGWTAKQFEVITSTVNPNKTITLEMMDYDVADFNEVLMARSHSIDSQLPGPWDVQNPYAVNLSGGPGADKLQVSWAPTGSGGLVRWEVFATRIAGIVTSSTDGIPWSVGHFPPDQTTCIFASVRNGDQWQASVQGRNALGVTSSLVTSSVFTVNTWGVATCSYGAVGVATGSVNLPVTMSNDCVYYQLYVSAGSASADTLNPTQISHYYADTFNQTQLVVATILSKFTYAKFQIYPYNGNGDLGTPSSIFATAVPQPPAGQAYTSSLTAPSALSASAQNSTTILLTFQTGSGTDTIIYRGGVQVADLGVHVTSYTDSPISQSTSFTYDAKSYKSSSQDYSVSAGSIVQATQTGTLGTPGSLTENDLGTWRVQLNWASGYPGGSGAYTIITRQSGSAAVQLVNSCSAGVTSFTDKDVEGGSYNFFLKHSRAAWFDSAVTTISGTYHA